ncbi:MAG TPA: glycoside hydrolase family 2 TIM barrel-domain containing protein [Candidatus Limnocylindrales bacterium]|nr:glycoside hydrolase family 2 TIM barrel-domain containing protein [Candidatus Limnocylindrales bacterium]
MRSAIVASGLLVVALAACLPAGTAGTLAPTLAMVEDGGLAIAIQNGLPVPSFDWQPRPRLDLDGPWRVEPVELDQALTMTERNTSLAEIEEEAGERHLAAYDDRGWDVLAVPGTTNPPPDGEEGGAWYRRTFEVPAEWAGRAVTLRFGSANYVADVWLNDAWLGYHEGGSTPFAFDVGERVRLGQPNVLAVRVHTIPLGTRSDTVPWGLIDWWNYGGLTGPVWLEASARSHVVRADVVPHLDAVEVEVLLANAERLAGARGVAPEAAADVPGGTATLRATILAASVNDDNLLDPDPRSLVADFTDPLAVIEQEVAFPGSGGVTGTTLTIEFGDADAWTPAVPWLYVLRVQLLAGAPPLDAREGRDRDEFWTTFGIRHVSVDPNDPQVLLNGDPAFFRGVGVHGETLARGEAGELLGGSPVQSPDEVRATLREAAAVGADLLRTGHQPADPTLLMLADRLGFAVWEEIPLYHATPLVFARTLERGVPQQMVREMALRDMNRPSVLFHGFANESGGGDERTDALRELHEVDRAIDGTRLTGQAAYGWAPDDPTQAPLDVAGFTFYHGVFYGEDPATDTRPALFAAHDANPGKPIMILEFGRWADEPIDEERQRVIFEETYAAIERLRGDRPFGFVAGATWWTLRDFATQISGIEVEDFGLYRPDGSLRPAGELAAEAFQAPAGRGDALALEPDLDRPRVQQTDPVADWSLAGYLAYAVSFSMGVLAVALLILTRRGGRAVGSIR